MTSTQVNFISRRVSQDDLSLFLDDIYLKGLGRPIPQNLGGYIPASRHDILLRHIPLDDGTHLLLLNPRYFKETHPK